MNYLLTPNRLKKFFFTFICPTFYGGGPSVPANTTSTVTQNTIPAELMPYATGMLSAAKGQLYTQDAAGKITGFQPYKPYSANATDYVAPFSSLQTQSQQGAGALQTPGQFAPATGMAGMGGIQSLNAGANFANQATDPNATAAYMSPYMQNVVQQQQREANRTYDISATKEMGQATQQGAFGGSREALMAAENERNRNMELANIQATGTQNAYKDAQQQQQYAATLGLQGAGQATNAAATLGNIGTAQLAAQQGIIGTQGAVGATQQAQNQKAIDQAVLDYQNAQQQPYTALGTMSALIHGTPMGNLSTQNYTAQPSTMSQFGGALGAAGSLYGASQVGKAEGGVIEDKHKYAAGGIAGFSVGGAVEADLYDMTPAQLQEVIQTATSDTERSMAKRILAEKSMANGGIVGFSGATGSQVKSKYKAHIGRNESDPEPDYGITDTAEKGLAELQKLPEYYLEGGKRITNRGIAAAKKLHEYSQYIGNKDQDMKLPVGSSEDSRDYVGELGSKAYDVLHPAPEEMKGIAAATPEGTSDFENPLSGLGHKLGSYAYDVLHPAPEEKKGIAAGLTPAVTTPSTPATEKVADFNSPATAYEVSTKGTPEERAQANAYIAENTGPGKAYTQWYESPEGRKVVAASVGQVPSTDPTTREVEKGLAGLRAPVVVSNAVPEAAPVAPEKERSLAEYQQEIRDAEEREGIKSPDDAAGEYRKSIMEEKSNAADESKRQTYLRMAEFFAHWGSTPGAPLVAGMKALTETMPGYLEDKKDQKKLATALNKSLYDLEAATRLEKKGDLKGAMVLKNQASERMMAEKKLAMEATLARQKMESEERQTASIVGGRADIAEKTLRNKASTSGVAALNASIRGLTEERKGWEAKLARFTLGGANPPRPNTPNYAEYKEAETNLKNTLNQLRSLRSQRASFEGGEESDVEDTGVEDTAAIIKELKLKGGYK